MHLSKQHTIHLVNICDPPIVAETPVINPIRDNLISDCVVFLPDFTYLVIDQISFIQCPLQIIERSESKLRWYSIYDSDSAGFHLSPSLFIWLVTHEKFHIFAMHYCCLVVWHCFLMFNGLLFRPLCSHLIKFLLMIKIQALINLLKSNLKIQ